MSTKKRVMWILIVAGILLTCYFAYRVIMLITSVNMPKAMFGSIEEMKCLDEYRTDAELDEDEKLSGLSVDESYCGIFSYNNKTYTIRAYTFTDNESAMMYYYGYIPREDPGVSTNSHNEANYISRKIRQENRILFIEGNAGVTAFSKFNDYFLENLSIRLVRNTGSGT